MGKLELAASIRDLRLTVESVFVPWSKSRWQSPSASPQARGMAMSLNWTVTLRRDGADIMTVDYSAGVGHCPSYTGGKTGAEITALTAECETGRRYVARAGGRGAPILPDTHSVIESVMIDASAIDHASFEAWASEHGYDSDSRMAECTYQACLRIGLAMRAGIGDDGIARLRAACADL